MKEFLTKAVLKIKRCYKNINKPVIRKDFDANIALFANKEAKEPITNVKITGDVSFKVLDIVLVLTAVSFMFCIVHGIFSIFKK